MKSQQSHALFERYPLEAEVSLSTGSAPSPYHMYDGGALFVGGAADLEAVQELMQHEFVYLEPR